MCVFCSIIQRDIPSNIIYEDDHVLAFLDITQVTKGHTLVIPKKHYDNVLSCDDEDLQRVTRVVQLLTKRIENALDCKGFNILSNMNEVAGQSVLHFHMHIIPRYTKEDAFHVTFDESEVQDLEALKKQLQ